MSLREDVLDEAKQIITVDRNATHGAAENTFEKISELWSPYLGWPVSPTQVAVMMALLKIARQSGNSRHQDNYIDGVGYLALAAELAATDRPA